jgi:hypothetical protein
LRKGLFAIVLIAASFSGGAVVNGPGFRWARDLILNQPGAEIATTNLGEVPPEPTDAVAPVAEMIPSTPIPPLVIAPAQPEAPPTAAPDATSPAAAPSSSSPATSVARADPAPPAPRPKAPVPPRSPESREKAPGSAAPGDFAPSANIPNALASSPGLEPPAPLSTSKDRDEGRDRPRGEPRDPAPLPTPAAPIDPEVALAALARDPGPINPEAPPSPSTASASPSSATSTAKRGPDDWGTLRRKMRALGVARYGIEGEPDGRVRFHCVIPLAGRRAVGQQFEAEGGDEIEAAQTALRRVALWRATEHPAP